MSLPETYKIIAGENGQPVFKEVPLTKPSTNQVLVKVAFAPIHPGDLNRIQGFYDKFIPGASSIIGSEGSGVIAAVGENLKVPHKVGDRVHVSKGSWGQYILANSEEVSPVLQDDISLEQASLHFAIPITVLHMGHLTEKGGHKAVIHTIGASALGKMLIKYLKQKGIKLINIVRKEEQIEELKALGADFVLNSQAPDFEAKLKELAEKESATIAFDAIAGDFTAKILTCQPPKSSCYAYGVLSGNPVFTGINRVELMKGKALKSMFLPNYLRDLTIQGKLGEVITEIHSLLPTTFKTDIHKIYDVKDVNEAIEYYQKNSSKGKVLLKINEF